jgi:hypothetical protein
MPSPVYGASIPYEPREKGDEIQLQCIVYAIAILRGWKVDLSRRVAVAGFQLQSVGHRQSPNPVGLQ